MARTEVEGTVASVNGTGTGFRVEESWPGRDGHTSRRFWSCWIPKGASTGIPNKGDKVKVVGLLSTKVGDRGFVDHTLNDVRLEITARRTHVPVEAPPFDEYPPDDPYTDGWSVAPIAP